MSNIPNLGEYGFIPPVADFKTVVSNTPAEKQEAEKQSSDSETDSTILSNKASEKIIENRVEVEEMEVDNIPNDESKKEAESLRKYLTYFIKGFLLILSGFFIFYVFNKFRKRESNVATTTIPSNVYACPPIPVDIECVNRNVYNPFLKNRVGYFPNSPNSSNLG